MGLSYSPDLNVECQEHRRRSRDPSSGNRAQVASAAGRFPAGGTWITSPWQVLNPKLWLAQGGPGPSGLCQVFSKWGWYTKHPALSNSSQTALQVGLHCPFPKVPAV